MNGCVSTNIGEVIPEQTLLVYGLKEKRVIDVSLEKLRQAWKTPLVRRFEETAD
jgi:hypothetical protein